MPRHSKPVLVAAVLITLLVSMQRGPRTSRADDRQPDAKPAKPAAKGKDEPEDKVGLFMRKKLTASQHVLEGLVLEDFDMITKGAREMEAMSRATDWQMIRSDLYDQFSNGFRQACRDLEQSAKDENVDAAGLAYMRLTMGCITCHNYVRKTMMAGEPDRPRDLGFDLSDRH